MKNLKNILIIGLVILFNFVYISCSEDDDDVIEYDYYMYVFNQNDNNSKSSIAKINLDSGVLTESWLNITAPSDDKSFKTVTDMIIKDDFLYITKGNYLFKINTRTENIEQFSMNGDKDQSAVQSVVNVNDKYLYIVRNQTDSKDFNANDDIVKFNIENNTIEKTIGVEQGPSDMVLAGSNLYVLNSNGKFDNDGNFVSNKGSISIIDTAGDKLLKNIELEGYTPFGNSYLAKIDDNSVMVINNKKLSIIKNQVIDRSVELTNTASSIGIGNNSMGIATFMIYNSEDFTLESVGIKLFNTSDLNLTPKGNSYLFQNDENFTTDALDYVLVTDKWKSEYAYIGSGYKGKTIRIIDMNTQKLIKKYDFTTAGWTGICVHPMSK